MSLLRKGVLKRNVKDSLGSHKEVRVLDLEDEESPRSKFAKLTHNYATSRQILFFNAVPPSQLLATLNLLTLPKRTIEEMTDATDHIQLLGRLKLLRNLSLLNYERALTASYRHASLDTSEAERYTNLNLKSALKAVKDNLYMIVTYLITTCGLEAQ